MSSQLPSNPYAPLPLEATSGAVTPAQIDFTPIVKRWEVYRLWYNLILTAYVLIWSAQLSPDALLEALYWFHLSVLGLVANLLFCLGPAAEGYGRVLRLWNNLMSRLLFLAGLLLTAGLATIFLFVRLR